MNEKEKYLRFLERRINAAVDNVAAAAGASVGISIDTNISEQEEHEILNALSDAATALGRIVDYIQQATSFGE